MRLPQHHYWELGSSARDSRTAAVTLQQLDEGRPGINDERADENV